MRFEFRWFSGLVIAVPLLAVAPVHAQVNQPLLLGAGYVANAPRMMAGGAVWAVLPGLGGFGVYLDGKLSLDSPANREGEYYPNWTQERIQEERPSDRWNGNEDIYYAVNAALLRVMTRELILYLGGGWVQKELYQQWYDEQELMGNFGFYWVEDPIGSGTGVNFMGGALLRIGRHLRVQFGGEARPPGFTVGVSVNYPGR